ncbi:UDP-galactose/UDP-N-acetylglucosamine transporter srf-3 [Galendromus occidentalis]|uniref:UDP-galactose/UDP-N-acetylglucosamine transporter srf-3 n=1 Tax=Galendromus occidentalis TaxID=34638 RepID=A0AAJ6QQ25_9ACAR|nr:UDP-galactose/UDP-N-acetylglucosamine transporter srf-3 [Galendromus occidentalis]
MISSGFGIESKDSVEAINSIDSDQEPLSREVPLLSATSVILCILLIATDVGRTCVSYSMRHFNDGVYPVDTTIVVTVNELFKATLVIGLHLFFDGDNPFKHLDARIALPCLLYAFTNNLFFLALHYITPATWLVLCQMRVVILLLIYRIFLKQRITATQYIGGLTLIAGVGLAQIDVGADFSTILGPVLGVAVLNSLFSATAGVFTEVVLKRGGDAGMWRNQTHLYCGSALISLLPALVSRFVFERKAFDYRKTPEVLTALVLLTVVLTAFNGICVSFVMKKLDNIVRFQVSAVTYIVTAGFNKFLFPKHFNPSSWYVMSIAVILFSVFLIEHKRNTPSQNSPKRVG